MDQINSNYSNSFLKKSLFVSKILLIPVSPLVDGLEVGILAGGIEARAVLLHPRQVAVSQDDEVGVVGLQRAQQCREGVLLCRCACVGRPSLLVQSALVADADGAVVVASGVCADHLLRPSDVQLSVACDVVVVPAHLVAAGAVAGVERLEGERAVGARRRSVDHCHVNSSHGTKIYVFTFLIDSWSFRTDRSRCSWWWSVL